MRLKIAFWLVPSLREELDALRSGNTKVVLEHGRMIDRLKAFAARLDREANPELRDVGDDLLVIARDEDPSW